MTESWEGRSTVEFGGEPRAFRLGFGELVAIEAETGLGYMEVWQQLATRRAPLAVVLAVLRYGLEGAGVSPQEAVRLVERYAKAPPFGDMLPIAAAVYSAGLWVPEDAAASGKPQGDGETGSDSPSP